MTDKSRKKERTDYKLIPTAPLEERTATRRTDEKLIEITLTIPEDNAAEIEAIAGIMCGDAGLFKTENLII